MYETRSDQVSVFEDETLFEVRGLDPENEWIRLAKLIPWSKLERGYAKTFDSEVGNAAKSARMAIGSLISQCQVRCCTSCGENFSIDG